MEIKAKPKLDLVFKKIFGDDNNVDLLLDFLSAVLDIPASEITEIVILDNELPPDVIDKKFSRLDLLLKTTKGYINIEIQVKNYGDFPERSLYYWSRHFSKQLNKKDKYSALEPTISINIIDFKLFPDKNKAHSTYKLLEVETHAELSDKLRIDFLELPKAKYCKDSRLKDWLSFLNTTTEEGLQMLESKTTTAPCVKKAIAVVRKMSADEKLLFEIEKREEALREEESAINFATNQGLQQGLQKGLKQGELIGKVKTLLAFINNGMSKEQVLQTSDIDPETFDKIVTEYGLE